MRAAHTASKRSLRLLGPVACLAALAVVAFGSQAARADPDTVAARFTLQLTSVPNFTFGPVTNYTLPGSALTGDKLTLDASSSTAPSGIASYEWDLDGDGTFETSGNAIESVTFSKLGPLVITLRVTSNAGGVGTSTFSTTVQQAPPTPPPGDIGISIDAGAQFTNTPNVTVSLVWPAGATNVRLSNDGGFAGAQQFDVNPTVPWQLQSSGPERLPKTVYARFNIGNPSMPVTYQDDIILDQTPPVVTEAAVAPPAGAARAARSTARVYKLKIKASDKLSGVAGMQITDNRRAPGKLLRYSGHATFKTAKSAIYVRAKDRAGNFSSWHRAAAAHRR
jgi:PKD domain